MNMFDNFYPVTPAMTDVNGGWQEVYCVQLIGKFRRARQRNRSAESKMINMIGQLRRNVPDFSSLNHRTRTEVAEVTKWLRAVGRSVDFTDQNPGMWITARDGMTPRF